MTVTIINIPTDSEITARAQSVLADLGLDLPTAVNVFLSQVVHRQAIPFEISMPVAKQAKPGGWEGEISMSPDFNEPLTPNGKLPRSALRGSLKGKVWMADDFDAPLEEMREYME